MVLNVYFITSLSPSFTSFEVTSFGVTCLKVTCWTAPPKQCILAHSAGAPCERGATSDLETSDAEIGDAETSDRERERERDW